VIFAFPLTIVHAEENVGNRAARRVSRAVAYIFLSKIQLPQVLSVSTFTSFCFDVRIGFSRRDLPGMIGTAR